jgi:hypothetical protein
MKPHKHPQVGGRSWRLAPSAALVLATAIQVEIGLASMAYGATNRLWSNETFTLQVSSNLLTWFNLTNCVARTNGVFQIVDPVPAKYPSRFYRLKAGDP